MGVENNFEELIDKYIRGTLAPSEKQAFFGMFRHEDIGADAEEYLWQNYQQNIRTQVWPEEFRKRFSERMAKNILAFEKLLREEQTPENIEAVLVHRVHFLRTAWFKYAAAILIILGLGVYLWTNNSNSRESATANSSKSLQTDIAPGGEKAVLTLADGTKIILDNAANGNLADQGNTRVVKLSDGKIVYNLQSRLDKELMWNTMSTPAGGQYQVILPDGTKVWLNAASSITYPTAFVGKDRTVKITGEVYFEVTKNKQSPFIVDVDGKSLVEVLGTSFNINSYTNEGSIKTTLLEGSVKVSKEDESAIIQPGQQALIRTAAVDASSDRQSAKNGKAVTVNSSVDVTQALAWKNGLFNFNGSDLRSVMRQLERWYDIRVQFEGPVSNDVFRGEMYRNVHLSDVLDMLREMDVKFRMEGKTLIVTG